MTGLVIRPGRRADLPVLVDIFNHYVENGHVTFDTVPSTTEERIAWFESYGPGRHQLLVAENEGQVIGCAYSSCYREHPAFDTTVETSIYLDPSKRGLGAGTRLYTTLLHRLTEQDVHQAVAGVALPNDASIALHRKLGFAEVGTFRDYARKHGVWISSTWFQRAV